MTTENINSELRSARRSRGHAEATEDLPKLLKRAKHGAGSHAPAFKRLAGGATLIVLPRRAWQGRDDLQRQLPRQCAQGAIDFTDYRNARRAQREIEKAAKAAKMRKVQA